MSWWIDMGLMKNGGPCRTKERQWDEEQARLVWFVPRRGEGFTGHCRYDLLGWTTDGRDLWFMYYCDKKSTFIRWGEGKLTHYNYRDAFPKSSYGLFTSFHPDRGWVFHLDPSDPNRSKDLFVSDLIGRHTINLGNHG